MKKKYLKPEMNVYEMEPQQLLAGSNPALYNGAPGDDNDDIFWTM